jgi:hypothetical protein
MDGDTACLASISSGLRWFSFSIFRAPGSVGSKPVAAIGGSVISEFGTARSAAPLLQSHPLLWREEGAAS